MEFAKSEGEKKPLETAKTQQSPSSDIHPSSESFIATVNESISGDVIFRTFPFSESPSATPLVKAESRELERNGDNTGSHTEGQRSKLVGLVVGPPQHSSSSVSSPPCASPPSTATVMEISNQGGRVGEIIGNVQPINPRMPVIVARQMTLPDEDSDSAAGVTDDEGVIDSKGQISDVECPISPNYESSSTPQTTSPAAQSTGSASEGLAASSSALTSSAMNLSTSASAYSSSFSSQIASAPAILSLQSDYTESDRGPASAEALESPDNHFEAGNSSAPTSPLTADALKSSRDEYARERGRKPTMSKLHMLKKASLRTDTHAAQDINAEDEDDDDVPEEELRSIASFSQLGHASWHALTKQRAQKSHLIHEGSLRVSESKSGGKLKTHWVRLSKSYMFAYAARYQRRCVKSWELAHAKAKVSDFNRFTFTVEPAGSGKDFPKATFQAPDGASLLMWMKAILKAQKGKLTHQDLADMLSLEMVDLGVEDTVFYPSIFEESSESITDGEVEEVDKNLLDSLGSHRNASFLANAAAVISEGKADRESIALAEEYSQPLHFGMPICLQAFGRWVSTSSKDRFRSLISFGNGQRLRVTQAQVTRQIFLVEYPYQDASDCIPITYRSPFRLRLPNGLYLNYTTDGYFTLASAEDCSPCLFRFVRASDPTPTSSPTNSSSSRSLPSTSSKTSSHFREKLHHHRRKVEKNLEKLGSEVQKSALEASGGEEGLLVRYNDSVRLECYRNNKKWGYFWGVKGLSRKLYDSNLYVNTHAKNSPVTFIIRHLLQPLRVPRSMRAVEGVFNIVNYNVWMLPNKISRFSSTSPLKMKRAEWIPPALSSVFPVADLVVFEEAFCRDARPVLLNGMKKHGFLHESPALGHVDGHAAKLLDGGVVLASRWPIEYTDTRLFGSVCSLEDRVADKGVLYARIRKYHRLFHVFATHMQAWSRPEAAKTRKHQMQIIKSFIEEKQIPSTDPVFVVGDLNIDRLLKDQNGEYYEMLEALSVEDTKFKSMEGPLCRNVSFDPTMNSLAQDTISSDGVQEDLDYILWSRQHLKPQRCQANYAPLFAPTEFTFNGHSCRDLSDHYPLFACFEFDMVGEEHTGETFAKTTPLTINDIMRVKGEKGHAFFHLEGLVLSVFKGSRSTSASSTHSLELTSSVHSLGGRYDTQSSAVSSPLGTIMAGSPPLPCPDNVQEISVTRLTRASTAPTPPPVLSVAQPLSTQSSENPVRLRSGTHEALSPNPDSFSETSRSPSRSPLSTSSPSSPFATSVVKQYAVMGVRDYLSSDQTSDKCFQILLVDLSHWTGDKRSAPPPTYSTSGDGLGGDTPTVPSSSPTSGNRYGSKPFRVYLESEEDKIDCLTCIRDHGKVRVYDAARKMKNKETASQLYAIDFSGEDLIEILRNPQCLGFHTASFEEGQRWLAQISATWYRHCRFVKDPIRKVVEAPSLELKLQWMDAIRKNLAIWGTELNDQFASIMRR